MKTEPDNNDYFINPKIDTVEAKRSDREEMERAKADFFAKGGKIKIVGSEANAHTDKKEWVNYNGHDKKRG